jgi:hypothetical protein
MARDSPLSRPEWGGRVSLEVTLWGNLFVEPGRPGQHNPQFGKVAAFVFSQILEGTNEPLQAAQFEAEFCSACQGTIPNLTGDIDRS